MHHNGNKQIFIRRNVTVRHGDNEDRRQNQLPAIFESFKEGYLNKNVLGTWVLGALRHVKVVQLSCYVREF